MTGKNGKSDDGEEIIRQALDAWLQSKLNDYKRAVNATGMAPSSKYTYNSMAEQFVRWTRDDFHPGAYTG